MASLNPRKGLPTTTTTPNRQRPGTDIPITIPQFTQQALPQQAQSPQTSSTNNKQLEDALNELIRKIYGGADNGIRQQVHDTLLNGLQTGNYPAQFLAQLNQNNGYIQSQFENIRRDFSGYANDPYADLENKLKPFQSKDPATLSADELNQYLSLLDEFAKTGKRKLVSQRQEIGPGSLGRTFKTYEDIPDSKPDISLQRDQIAQILNSRKLQNENQQQMTNFLTDVPAQLEAERNRFFRGQGSRAVDYLTGTYAPRVMESLAARGIADSGQFGASLADKYGEIQSTIESEQAAQEQEDLKFYADLAYKTTYQNLIDTTQNVQNQITNQYNVASQKQSQGFQQRQANIENKFNLDLFTRESQAAVDAAANQQQYKAWRQKQATDNANMASAMRSGVTIIGGAGAGSMAGMNSIG